MDEWEHAKRQCQLHFEAWRKVKGVGVGVESKDKDDDDDNGGDY